MKGGKKALARYKKFHGRSPEKNTKINFPYPKQLVLLGKGVAIEYESDKVFGNRPRKKRLFRHKFGRKVKIYTDPQGKALYIVGGKFRVTDWLRG